MPAPNIESRIREFVASNFGFRGASLNMDGNLDLIQQGILDSTGVLEVVAFLENDLGVKVEDDEMIPENLGTMSRMISFVSRKKGSS
ncbi:MAG TPA: acyl carrier protein [Polyangiaceae bacterium]|nr:acyl carrier protein [Polyangiaceae bacterium]